MLPRQTGHFTAGLLCTHLAHTMCPQLPSTTLVALRSMQTGQMFAVGSLISSGATPRLYRASPGCPPSTSVTSLQTPSRG